MITLNNTHKFFENFINDINNAVKQKYNFSDEQVISYFKGIEDNIQDNNAYMDKQNKILDDTVTQLVEATNLLKLVIDELIPKNCDYCNQNPNDDDCHPYLCRDWENTITHWKHYDEVIQLLKECDCFDDRSES